MDRAPELPWRRSKAKVSPNRGPGNWSGSDGGVSPSGNGTRGKFWQHSHQRVRNELLYMIYCYDDFFPIGRP
ncbi:hypothetical protein V6N13_137686 [Hibiscus sabdariffa]